MADDNLYGQRDSRGHWAPDDKPQINPLFSGRWTINDIAGWLKGYFLPWNLLFMALGLFSFYLLAPYKTQLAAPDWWWLGLIAGKNAAIILVIYGALELHLYVRRRQEGRFKYNPQFPGARRSDKFLFGSQYKDNIFRTFLSGIPIWSAYELLIMWCWAHDIGLWSAFSDHPVWLGVFFLITPLVHELHFYLVHRLLHIPPLYKYIHSVHHRAVNPTPLSSLSMHPLEHLLYWSDSLVHLVLPSHPFLALYHLQLTGTGAVVGHIGFDRIELNRTATMPTHAFAHYLHHKYFDVNFGDGSVPVDRLFGTWHDGTQQSEAAFRKRMRAARETKT